MSAFFVSEVCSMQVTLITYTQATSLRAMREATFSAL